MQANQLPVPFAEGYVPYFYLSGQHERYGLSRPTADSWKATDAFANHSLDIPQTVDQIVRHGYFNVPRREETAAIIADRTDTTRLGLDDVVTQVRRRYEIHNRILYQIDLSICAANNAIYQHEAYCGPGSATSKQHYAKHKAIRDLYEEQRAEQVNLWKDVSRLRSGLPEIAQQYLAAYRKESILRSGTGGDS